VKRHFIIVHQTFTLRNKGELHLLSHLIVSEIQLLHSKICIQYYVPRLASDPIYFFTKKKKTFERRRSFFSCYIVLLRDFVLLRRLRSNFKNVVLCKNKENVPLVEVNTYFLSVHKP